VDVVGGGSVLKFIAETSPVSYGGNISSDWFSVRNTYNEWEGSIVRTDKGWIIWAYNKNIEAVKAGPFESLEAAKVAFLFMHGSEC
jgi:hypothetical protein